MKRLLLAPLILGLGLPVQAKDTCTFTSQYQPEVTIEVSTENVSWTKGLIKYRNTPIFNFGLWAMNGYGGQSFEISAIPKSSTEEKKKIAWGRALTFVGDQANKGGTPIKERKKGQKKFFFPRSGVGYYYSLATEYPEPDGRFEGRTEKMNTILSAAEGFWIPSKVCERFLPYGW